MCAAAAQFFRCVKYADGRFLVAKSKNPVHYCDALDEKKAKNLKMKKVKIRETHQQNNAKLLIMSIIIKTDCAIHIQAHLMKLHTANTTNSLNGLLPGYWCISLLTVICSTHYRHTCSSPSHRWFGRSNGGTKYHKLVDFDPMRTNFSNKFILLRIFRWSVHSFHVSHPHIHNRHAKWHRQSRERADPSDLHKKKILGFGFEMERASEREWILKRFTGYNLLVDSPVVGARDAKKEERY